MNKIIRLLPLLSLTFCQPDNHADFVDQTKFDQAKHNAHLANASLQKCERYLKGWMAYRDPESGLIPRNINESKDFWNAKDAAADNYPFMVLSSFFVDQQIFENEMLDILRKEKMLTSRVGALPDTYSFSGNDFLKEEVNLDEIIFGASEYIKDGLLPLTEWLGESPWSERMLEMLYDLKNNTSIAEGVNEKGYGRAPREEVNGELLQVLSRIYWMTGDESLLDWAIQIGDFYLLGDHHPTKNLEYLRLRDHGCELISGLCELYITCYFANKPKYQAYQQPLYDMLDRILEAGRNEHGFFYDAINPMTGEVIEERIADTWGYTLNGYYGIYLIDGKEEYLAAVKETLSNLHHYKNHNWEGNADGYADAIESALNLYNRITDPDVARWIDSEIKVMWSMQQESGIIEGWHGDGNFARTTIMYHLWKSKGLYIHPWREDVELGAELKGDTLLVSIKSQDHWEGTMHFDSERHKNNLHLPIDWPRINQFPEWYTVDDDHSYNLLKAGSDKVVEYSGKELLEGLAIDLQDSAKLLIY